MRHPLIWLLILCWCTSSALYSLAQDDEKPAKPRAKPKKFSQEETSRVFFDNVFDELIGARPDLQNTESLAGAGPPTNATANSQSSSGSGPPGGRGWSKLISSTTIENEMKAIKLIVDRDVSTPADFKGRGYEECRVHFSVAATLFGIIQEYDGEVRWKSDAAAARDAFARTGSNAKVGTAQVFNEAKQRKLELEDLLNGNGFPGKATMEENEWPGITDRSPLMKRLEAAFEGIIRPGTANENDFKAKKDALAHEAELIAALAAVLTKEGMEDGDDETYQEFATGMRDAALAIVDGTRQGNYDQVRAAVGTIDQSCTSCHDMYR